MILVEIIPDRKDYNKYNFVVKGSKEQPIKQCSSHEIKNVNVLDILHHNAV